MLIRITTNNFQETQKLGEKMAKNFLISKKDRDNALVLALEGELGGGKTTFVQGFAKGLGIREKILSPTFVILKKFSLPTKKNNLKNKILTLYHLDCYRIHRPKEILDLGFKEMLNNPQNVILIEWAEKIKKILPKNAIVLKFKFIDKNQREILLK